MRANTRRGLIGLMCLVVSWSSGGCNRAQGGPPETTTALAPATQEREARLLERCAKRWEKVSQNAWIEAYDFLAPAERKAEPLQDFLRGKVNHRYENPEAPRTVKLDGDVGYVLTASLWTPTHPALSAVDLGKGESLTQRLEVVEMWRWTEGDWYYVKARSAEEFFTAHPDLARPADGLVSRDPVEPGR